MHTRLKLRSIWELHAIPSADKLCDERNTFALDNLMFLKIIHGEIEKSCLTLKLIAHRWQRQRRGFLTVYSPGTRNEVYARHTELPIPTSSSDALSEIYVSSLLT